MPRGVPLVGRARVRAELKRNILIALAGLVLLIWLCWPRSSPQPRPPPGQASIKRRVVAVADLHGDLEHAHHVLRMVNVIDSDANWAGGDTLLVSTGDIVDRGDDTQALYRLFDRLRAQAPLAGGHVLSTLGNHEVMNSLGDWRYVTPGDIKTFGTPRARWETISSEGWIGQTWGANYSITHLVSLLPEHLVAQAKSAKSQDGSPEYFAPRVSFVHGGITPSFAARGPTYINRLGQELLGRTLRRPLNELNGHLPRSSPDTERELWSADGPLWYRGYALDPDSQACGNAVRALEGLSMHSSYDVGSGAKATGQVDHLVMGHTPHFDGHVVRCPEAQILLIDTGISRAYGGEQSALVFETELVPPAAASSQFVRTETHAARLLRLFGRSRPSSSALPASNPPAALLGQRDPRSPPPWTQHQKITSFYYGRLPRSVLNTKKAVYL